MLLRAKYMFTSTKLIFLVFPRVVSGHFDTDLFSGCFRDVMPSSVHLVEYLGKVGRRTVWEMQQVGPYGVSVEYQRCVPVLTNSQ